MFGANHTLPRVDGCTQGTLRAMCEPRSSTTTGTPMAKWVEPALSGDHHQPLATSPVAAPSSNSSAAGGSQVNQPTGVIHHCRHSSKLIKTMQPAATHNLSTVWTDFPVKAVNCTIAKATPTPHKPRQTPRKRERPTG